MSWVTSVSTFRDFLSLVIVHAPDDFPEEDFLKSDEQLDLNRAFEELRRGLSFLGRSGESASHIANLAVLLDRSLAAYRAGDDIAGANLLQDLEAQAFGSSHGP